MGVQDTGAEYKDTAICFSRKKVTKLHDKKFYSPLPYLLVKYTRH